MLAPSFCVSSEPTCTSHDACPRKMTKNQETTSTQEIPAAVSIKCYLPAVGNLHKSTPPENHLTANCYDQEITKRETYSFNASGEHNYLV